MESTLHFNMKKVQQLADIVAGVSPPDEEKTKSGKDRKKQLSYDQTKLRQQKLVNDKTEGPQSSPHAEVSHFGTAALTAERPLRSSRRTAWKDLHAQRCQEILQFFDAECQTNLVRRLATLHRDVGATAVVGEDQKEGSAETGAVALHPLLPYLRLGHHFPMSATGSRGDFATPWTPGYKCCAMVLIAALIEQSIQAFRRTGAKVMSLQLSNSSSDERPSLTTSARSVDSDDTQQHDAVLRAWRKSRVAAYESLLVDFLNLMGTHLSATGKSLHLVEKAWLLCALPSLTVAADVCGWNAAKVSPSCGAESIATLSSHLRSFCCIVEAVMADGGAEASGEGRGALEPKADCAAVATPQDCVRLLMLSCG